MEPQLASREGLETQSTSLQDAPLIDYGNSAQFPWKSKLDDVLKGTFGIESLRLCQEGVLNAVLDNRDVVCTLPVSLS